MKSRRYPDVPNLATLLVFDAAAHHQNFVKAGDELAISASAVAHHIKNLENSIDTRLFERHAQGVSLNTQGHEFYALVHNQLIALQQHCARLRGRHNEPLRITTQHAIAQFWLQPVLSAYQSEYEDHDFEVTAVSTIEPYPLDTDLAIGFFAEAPTSPGWTRLWSEKLIPVRAPGFSDDKPLLHQDMHWLEDWNICQAGNPDADSIQPTRVRRSSLYALAVQSVLDAQGIVVARTSLLDRYLQDGSLVGLSGFAPVDYGGYFLYRSPSSTLAPIANHFVDWLFARLQTP